MTFQRTRSPTSPHLRADPRERAIAALLALEDPTVVSQTALREVLDPPPSLVGQDRGLCTELVYGVLRRQRALDRWVATSCRDGLFGLAPAALVALRLGALQIADMRIPPHAAVHATMEAAKRFMPPRLQSLVHAVLRNLDRRAQVGDVPDHDDLPAWLERRVADWAQSTGQAHPQAIASLSRPAPLFVHALDGDAPALAALLETAGVPAQPLTEVQVPGVLRCTDGQFLRSEVFGARRALAQDAGSSAVVEWFLAALEQPETLQIADVAAGHGVKSARLTRTGAQVTAMDVSARKLEDAVSLCAQSGHPLFATIAGDATTDLGLETAAFDAILLDAPCTALGTLRRRPELRHRRGAADILRMADLQRRLLDQAAKWLRPGGVLCYAVCSFLPEEGEAQVTRFLASHPDFARLEVGTPWLSAWLTPTGDLLTPPQAEGPDGFFAARLKKIG